MIGKIAIGILAIVIFSGCISSPVRGGGGTDTLKQQLDLQLELENTIVEALAKKHYADSSGKQTAGLHLRKDGAVYDVGTLVDFNNPNSMISSNCAAGEFPETGMPLSSIHAKFKSDRGFKVDPEDKLAAALGIAGSQVKLSDVHVMSVKTSEVQQFLSDRSVVELKEQAIPCILNLDPSVYPDTSVGVVRGYVSLKYTLSNVDKFEIDAGVKHEKLGEISIWWNDSGEFLIEDTEPRKLPIVMEIGRLSPEQLDEYRRILEQANEEEANSASSERKREDIIREILNRLSYEQLRALRGIIEVNAFEQSPSQLSQTQLKFYLRDKLNDVSLEELELLKIEIYEAFGLM